MKFAARLLGLDSLVPQKSEERIIAFGTLVNTFGNGLFYTVSALYFTRIVGLSATQVGVGLSLAAAAGVAGGFISGRLSDIYDPRKITLFATAMTGVGLLGLALVQSFEWFIALAIVETFFDRCGMSSRSVIISRVGGPEGRVAIRAYLRAVTNVGIGAGSLLAGVALAVDTPWAYRALIVADGITNIVAVAALMRLPQFPPLPAARHERSTEALRDIPFMGLVGLNAILAMHYTVLELAVPLWIVSHTSAPRWVVAVAFLLNTVACVVFQVRLSRGAETARGAAAVTRSSASYLFISMCIYAAASLVASPWIAALIILLAASVHVTGELRQAAGSFGIGFGIPPEHLQGQYQGVWSLGPSLSHMAAPIIVTGFVLTQGILGWFTLGLVFALAGLATPYVVEKAVARQERRYG